MLRTARSSALKARTAVQNQISGVLTPSPKALHARYRSQSSDIRVKSMAACRPSGDVVDPAVAAAVTLKRMGIRYQFLDAETHDTDAALAHVITVHALALLGINGVGAVGA